MDLFYYPDPVGGYAGAIKILKNQVESTAINIEKFLDYAVKFPSIVTRKKIGYAAEQADVSASMLKRLNSSISNSSLVSLYEFKNRIGPISSKWRAIINAPQK